MTIAANLAALANRVVGVLPLNLIALDANGKLPAVDGSQLTNLNVFGSGMLSYDVTASRAFNTVYQNTTGKPLVVTIAITTANGSTGYLNFNIGPTSALGSAIGYLGSSSASTQTEGITVIVPPGYFYQLAGSGPVLSKWTEYRP